MQGTICHKVVSYKQTINGYTLEKVNDMKDHGVIFRSDLSWNSLIESSVNQAS